MLKINKINISIFKFLQINSLSHINEWMNDYMCCVWSIILIDYAFIENVAIKMYIIKKLYYAIITNITILIINKIIIVLDYSVLLIINYWNIS